MKSAPVMGARALNTADHIKAGDPVPGGVDAVLLEATDYAEYRRQYDAMRAMIGKLPFSEDQQRALGLLRHGPAL